MNLFDIMRQAGGGDAFRQLASQYGLSEDQIAKAVQAFMPAFSSGLKRSTGDPLGLMEFMRRLSAGDYLRAYQNPDWAAGGGRGSGEDALKFLFGSPDAARALAAQAAAFTGLGADKLTEILPALAAMLFGGIGRQSAAANPMLDAMLKQFQAAAAGQGAKGPLDRYEAEEAERQRGTVDQLASVPGEMMQAGLAAFQAGTAAWQKTLGDAMKGAAAAAGGEKPGAGAPSQNVFGEMFESGLRLGETYQREVEAMLDRLRPETRRS